MNPRKTKQKAVRKGTKQLHGMSIHSWDVCTIQLKMLLRYVSINVERTHRGVLVTKLQNITITVRTFI